MALPFLETYITYEAVLKLLIHYRCKEAERIQRILVVDDLAVKAKPNPTDIRDEELYAMFPPRRKWIHVDYENRKNLSQIGENHLLLILEMLLHLLAEFGVEVGNQRAVLLVHRL